MAQFISNITVNNRYDRKCHFKSDTFIETLFFLYKIYNNLDEKDYLILIKKKYL